MAVQVRAGGLGAAAGAPPRGPPANGPAEPVPWREAWLRVRAVRVATGGPRRDPLRSTRVRGRHDAGTIPAVSLSSAPLRALSVIPPMTQLNTPYPSTAYLTGFLRSRGVPAFQADLALQLVLKLSQTCFLATTINYWDTVGHMVVQKTMNTLAPHVQTLSRAIKQLPHLTNAWAAVVACLVMELDATALPLLVSIRLSTPFHLPDQEGSKSCYWIILVNLVYLLCPATFPPSR